MDVVTARCAPGRGGHPPDPRHLESWVAGQRLAHLLNAFLARRANNAPRDARNGDVGGGRGVR